MEVKEFFYEIERMSEFWICYAGKDFSVRSLASDEKTNCMEFEEGDSGWIREADKLVLIYLSVCFGFQNIQLCST